MIRIRDLRVDYDNVCAVDDLSLSVEPGEVCGLIGPNGAGKTTTMKALLGLIEPTYGEIEVMGVDMRERPEDVYRIMGFMPDFPPVYEDLLVWEFLDLFAASYGIPRAAAAGRSRSLSRNGGPLGEAEVAGRRAVARHAATVDAGQDADSRSRGCCLLDEPASGVDPQGRIELKNILRRLAEEKRTVLISSHILTEMDEFCTSVAIMERGKLKVGGRIDEVNQRIMGDTLISVEVLGDAERFLDRSCVRRPRRGLSSERTSTPTNFASRAIRRRPVSCFRRWCTAACGWPLSRGGATTWKSCS